MVHNRFEILDEGENKFLSEINMPREKYIDDFMRKLFEARVTQAKYENYFNDGKFVAENREEWLQFKECEAEYEKIRADPYIMESINFSCYDKLLWKGNKRMADYMGVIPFMPCVMLNISPNWKGKYGKDKLTDKIMCKKFQLIIEKYLNACNRYSKWKYVLESGGEGNFLHAHIVAEINPKIEKSTITHLNKGNHAIDLRKIWNKNMPKGNEGLLKGKFAVQRILLRNEELKNDKLKYLIEDNKPEGHQNLENLGILQSRGF